MQNKTVIILNDYCHINGGASKVAIDEAVALAVSGVNVIFIGACAPICSELVNAPLQVICLEQIELINAKRNPLVMLQGLWNFKAARVMREVLEGRYCGAKTKQSVVSFARLVNCFKQSWGSHPLMLPKNDTIIHLHGYTKALTTSPVRVANSLGFKLVCTLHDFFSACPNGAFFDYVRCKPCPKIAMSFDCVKTQCDKRHYIHKLYRVVRTFVQQKIGGLPKDVIDYITLSEQSSTLLRPYLPKNARYYPLENPIDVPYLPKVEVGLNKSVVAIGRLDAEKGIEILLEAAKKAEIYLTLVGDGPLRGLAESYTNCQVTGWISSVQVVEELAKARALVFPSLWYETYGLVVAEAMARGVPAIVSNISAAAERVEDGKTGWHMYSGDVDDLVRCLRLTHDNEIVSRVGGAAYSVFWASSPTSANHVEKLKLIYNRILEL